MRKPWLFLTPLALAGGFALTSIPAHATFVIDTSCTDSGCTGSVDFKNDSAVKGVTSFTGTVGGHAGSAVTVDTTGAIDTGAGFSTIKPVKGGTLTDLLFTPADDTLFSDFSFRGQLNPVDDTGIISVKWTDSAGTSGTIMFTGVAGPDTDFARLGIDSTDGETLKSVEVSTAGGESFNEFKQVQFSGAGITPIPEPSTYVLMLLGFAGLGYAGLHKAKSGRRDVAIA